jgi:hypothetical protein
MNPRQQEMLPQIEAALAQEGWAWTGHHTVDDQGAAHLELVRPGPNDSATIQPDGYTADIDIESWSYGVGLFHDDWEPRPDDGPKEWWELPPAEAEALIRATPWHKRSWLVGHRLTPPVSRWGKAIFYALMPFAILLWLAQWVILPV